MKARLRCDDFQDDVTKVVFRFEGLYADALKFLMGKLEVELKDIADGSDKAYKVRAIKAKLEDTVHLITHFESTRRKKCNLVKNSARRKKRQLSLVTLHFS